MAEKLLKSQGYVVAHDRGVCVFNNRGMAASPHADKKNKEDFLFYGCVWGVRLNVFETRHFR